MPLYMNRRRLFSLFIVACACVCVCAQQLHTIIDVLQPAEFPLSATLENVVIVNNAITQPADFGHQTKISSSTIKRSVDLSAAPLHCLFALQQNLEEQETCSDIALVSKSQNHSSNFYRRVPLTATQADSILTLNGANALIALNQLIIYDLEECYLTDEELYYSYLQAYASSHWSVYFRGVSKPQQMVVSDTLIWQNWDQSAESALKALPDRQEALLALAAYVGEHFAQRIQPQWKPVDRYFYESKDEFLLAGNDALAHRRFQLALDCWQKAYSSASPRQYLTRAHAAANMAVVYEMSDDLKAAIEWTNRAIDAFHHLKTADALQQQVNLRYYRTQLQSRLSK